MTRPRCVGLLVPHAAGAPTGNEISARRLADGLEARGVHVEQARPDDGMDDVVARFRAAGVDLVHAFHAWRTGPLARRVAGELGVPYVVTITGTDVALHVHDAERLDAMRPVLCNAAATLCGYPEVVGAVARLCGAEVPTIVYPKGVRLPEPAATATAAPDGDASGRLLVLQVAHLRPVKNNLLAVRAIRRLEAEGAAVRLVLLGDCLDPAYAAALETAAGGAEAWSAMWRPAVPHAAVGEWYAAADVVVNTSDSEGGSNAILEAMAHGLPVVASAVPGNVAYVGDDGTRGLLYRAESAHGESQDGSVRHDEDALVDALRRLAADAGLRARLGARARAFVAERHDPAAELDAVVGAYATALARS